MQVLATSARMIVQDCVEAEENVDARDKFFMYPVAMADIRVCVCVLDLRGHSNIVCFMN